MGSLHSIVMLLLYVRIMLSWTEVYLGIPGLRRTILLDPGLLTHDLGELHEKSAGELWQRVPTEGVLVYGWSTLTGWPWKPTDASTGNHASLPIRPGETLGSYLSLLA